MTDEVFTPGLLGKVDRLYASAVRSQSVRIDGLMYDLTFDGRNYVATVASSGEHIATFNTRKVTQARAWLREYVA